MLILQLNPRTLASVADRHEAAQIDRDGCSPGSQLIGWSTALVHDPAVIALDEPFSGLDPVAVASLSETLRQRVRDGRTVLFSSHQLDLVEDPCEDIAA